VISVTPPAAVPPGKGPGTRWVASMVGLSAGLDGFGKSHPPLGFDPRTVQPLASRYTDRAVPVHKLSEVQIILRNLMYALVIILLCYFVVSETLDY
jgi:hypothetical protein